MNTIVTIALGVLAVLIVSGFVFICVNVFLTPGKRFLDDEAESNIPAPQRHGWIDYIPRTRNLVAAVVAILIIVVVVFCMNQSMYFRPNGVLVHMCVLSSGDGLLTY